MLETEFETADGAVRVIDFMPRRAEGPPRLMRIVEGLRGRVPMRMDADAAPGLRVDHPVAGAGARRRDCSAGPDAFRLSTPLALQIVDGTVNADFAVAEGAGSGTL